MTTQSTLSSSMCVRLSPDWQVIVTCGGLNVRRRRRTEVPSQVALASAARSGRVSSMSSSMHFAVCSIAQS